MEGDEVRPMLAVDVVARQAELAGAAARERLNHDPVADLHPPGLADLDDLARRLVAELVRRRAFDEGLVLGAHRRRVHLDDRPLALRPWVGHVDQPSLPLADDRRLLHLQYLRPYSEYD